MMNSVATSLARNALSRRVPSILSSLFPPSAASTQPSSAATTTGSLRSIADERFVVSLNHALSISSPSRISSRTRSVILTELDWERVYATRETVLYRTVFRTVKDLSLQQIESRGHQKDAMDIVLRELCDYILEKKRDDREREALRRVRTKAHALLKRVHNVRGRIDKHDKWAIKDYTGPGFGHMNQALRGSIDMSPELRQRIDAVRLALSKSRLGVYSGIVYRGSDLPPKLYAELKTGATFCDPSFLSCSVLKEKAFKKSILFEIESRTGKDVSKYSHHQDEMEVLFRPGVTFRIESFDEKAGVVKMKEMH